MIAKSASFPIQQPQQHSEINISSGLHVRQREDNAGRRCGQLKQLGIKNDPVHRKRRALPQIHLERHERSITELKFLQEWRRRARSAVSVHIGVVHRLGNAAEGFDFYYYKVQPSSGGGGD